MIELRVMSVEQGEWREGEWREGEWRGEQKKKFKCVRVEKKKKKREKAGLGY